MGDPTGEHIWHKRGLRFELPSRLSRTIVLRAAVGAAVVSLTLIGLLAVPAGSPPPPPAVAAAASPAATSTAAPLVDSPIPQPSYSATVTQNGDPPPCVPTAKPVATAPERGTVVSLSSDWNSITLYDPRTGRRSEPLTGNVSCGFRSPRFVDDHTIAYTLDGPTTPDNGTYFLDLTKGTVGRVPGSRTDWEWLATSAISPDGSQLAEIGEVHSAGVFTLRVSSTSTGKLLYKRSLGYVCYCDGGWFPIELRWSPDGDLLFVAVPDQKYGTELFLLNGSGANVRSPVPGGAYPRWIGSSRAFLYMDANGNWVRVDSIAGRPTILLRHQATLADPVVSPDLRRVAYWDNDKLNIVVFDFASRTMKRFGMNRGNPLWLDIDTLVITGIKTCQCDGLNYTGLNWALSLSSGKTRRVPVNSAAADVLF